MNSKSRLALLICCALGLGAPGLVLAEHQYAPEQQDRDQQYRDQQDQRQSRDQQSYQSDDSDQSDSQYGDGSRDSHRDSSSDEAIHERVHHALESRLGTAARNISVEVRDRSVYLSGSVRSSRTRRAAHDIAHGVCGMNEVYADGLRVRRY